MPAPPPEHHCIPHECLDRGLHARFWWKDGHLYAPGAPHIYDEGDFAMPPDDYLATRTPDFETNVHEVEFGYDRGKGDCDLLAI